MVAQVAALDHPSAFSALTLVGTRSIAAGRIDAALPDHDPTTMKRLFSRPMPDRAAVPGARLLVLEEAATAIADEVAAAMLALMDT
jgi:hypothetical protein